ncbi:aminopeptidase P family N-terminal domain-containing protein [Tabrizicola sp.]|uniref:aminopeptidase P family N-terminal domain-containing protein n=1 Tax=Tabrizicola sp. TaxID=2005166 RepID=UPI0027356C2F|nr:aminopeptidase P family N-terminal domain-containing protein [Tabrizicola sp.]MDP3196882.1 aminopeptidase P family N-terminal domain-containing protein [Tabrizicola sp.]
MTRLQRLDWPDNGTPDLPPRFTLAEADQRMMAVRAAMSAAGYAALVVYGDREHAANLHWLTGFDPRFEEAVLVVTEDDALLITGNECLAYTAVSPLVAAGRVRTGLCASLSLPSQPRDSRRLWQWLEEVVPSDAKVGAVGWKWYGSDELAPGHDPALALDIPAFLADPLRQRAGRVENATAVFMHPGHGLRARVTADEIARLEYSNHLAASALRRMMFSFRDGMTDFAAIEAARIGGLPLGCHLTFAMGETPGLSGPIGDRIRLGVPASFNIAHWGSNICRAGWMARGDYDLPASAAGYLEEFVFPYIQALSDWCGMMRPGVAGGAVWAMIHDRLPAEFGITLNPGHLIGVDEWMSSPIMPESGIPLASGMAMQMDVIPAHPHWGSTRMEDGYVIADEGLREELAQKHPNVARRCALRAEFMVRVIGMEVPETLLPLADTCGIIAPWLLDPAQVVVL